MRYAPLQSYPERTIAAASGRVVEIGVEPGLAGTWSADRNYRASGPHTTSYRIFSALRLGPLLAMADERP